MKKYIITVFIIFLALPINLFAEEETKKDGVWYKVNNDEDPNSIYVDYKSIKKKEGKVKYEQMEFLIEKQKLEGTNKEYKFIVSKRKGDCDNNKYLIIEDKFYDVQVNKEKNEIKDELVFKNNYEDNPDNNWIAVIPGSLIEKVWRFTCLYKAEDN